jgi:hypothetical protein
VPLWIGAEGGGVAYLGLVLTFSPLPVFPAPIVFCVDVLEELDALESLEELLDDPQPATSATATQAINVEEALLIEDRTLA